MNKRNKQNTYNTIEKLILDVELSDDSEEISKNIANVRAMLQRLSNMYKVDIVEEYLEAGVQAIERGENPAPFFMDALDELSDEFFRR